MPASQVSLGKNTATVKSYNQSELEVFGCLQGTDAKTANTIIRQAIIAGYLDKDIENFGLLKVTKKAT